MLVLFGLEDLVGFLDEVADGVGVEAAGGEGGFGHLDYIMNME